MQTAEIHSIATAQTALRPKYARRFGLRDADAVMNVLRREMYEWGYKELAKEVGVSPACIMAIRSGRTKWPRPKTFFGLLEALDLELLVKKR